MPVDKQNRHPPRWVELVVFLSAHPKERHDELLALRRRYRRLLASSPSNPERARRLAYREAFYWMVRAWPERLLHMWRLFWYLIFQSGGGS